MENHRLSVLVLGCHVLEEADTGAGEGVGKVCFTGKELVVFVWSSI